MKIKELRAKSVEELGKGLVVFKKELFNLRFQKVQGQVSKTHRIRQLKRAVARSYTLLVEMKLGKNAVAQLDKAAIVKDTKKEVKKQIVKEVKAEDKKSTKDVVKKAVKSKEDKQQAVEKNKLSKD